MDHKKKEKSACLSLLLHILLNKTFYNALIYRSVISQDFPGKIYVTCMLDLVLDIKGIETAFS